MLGLFYGRPIPRLYGTETLARVLMWFSGRLNYPHRRDTMPTKNQVRYVYHCAACGHAGEVRRMGHQHDYTVPQAHCDSCDAPVVLEDQS